MSDATNLLEDLTFIKLKVPRLIPLHLVEGVKKKTFTCERFYEYQDLNVNNPNNHLYALVNPMGKIMGYLWAETNALDDTLFINTFSVDKELWGMGKSIPLVVEFLKSLKAKLKAPRCYWITTNDRYFKKHGFKRSKQCLLEYT